MELFSIRIQRTFQLVSTTAVSYITKLLNWKQITTKSWLKYILKNCSLYHKFIELKLIIALFERKYLLSW